MNRPRWPTWALALLALAALVAFLLWELAPVVSGAPAAGPRP